VIGTNQQVCIEGGLSQKLIGSHQSQRSRYGDLIPWTLLQQFGEQEFSQMSGVRVVRVATHPAYQRVSLLI